MEEVRLLDFSRSFQPIQGSFHGYSRAILIQGFSRFSKIQGLLDTMAKNEDDKLLAYLVSRFRSLFLDFVLRHRGNTVRFCLRGSEARLRGCGAGGR